MLSHAFDRLGLHRVGLSVFEFNERARRAYEKAGFQVEGRLRAAIARDGRWWDELQMGILNEEWLERRDRLSQATTAGSGSDRVTAMAQGRGRSWRPRGRP